jgi:hypothetical protein
MLESYKGSITRSKRKQIQIPKVGEISTSEKGRHLVMGDRQEGNKNPKNHEEIQIAP